MNSHTFLAVISIHIANRLAHIGDNIFFAMRQVDDLRVLWLEVNIAYFAKSVLLQLVSGYFTCRLNTQIGDVEPLAKFLE